MGAGQRAGLRGLVEILDEATRDDNRAQAEQLRHTVSTTEQIPATLRAMLAQAERTSD